MKKKKQALRKLITGLCLVLFSAGILNAATYYVGPSGNDGNDGLSSSTPFLTTDKAIAVVVANGGPEENNVILLGGSWSNDNIRMRKNTETANWTSNLVFEGENSNVMVGSLVINTARITVRGVKVSGVSHGYGAEYVILEDIVGVGGTYWKIEASNITWRRCKATDVFTDKIDIVRIAARDGDAAKVPTHILIEDCCFRGSDTDDGNHIDVIQTLGVVDLTIRNCKIYNAPTGLFMPTNLGDVPIKDILIENCYFAGGRLYGSRYAENWIYRNNVMNCNFNYARPQGIDEWTGNIMNSYATITSVEIPDIFENNIVKSTAQTLPPSNIIDPNVVFPEPPCAADEVVDVTGVNLVQSAVTLSVNETAQLTANVLPSNATHKSVTWSSSNSSVASVNAYGLVSALSGGTATITVTTTEGSFTDQCTITSILDTQAPSAPTGLTAGTVTVNSVALSWTASTDNMSVTGYKVYTNGANPIDVTGTSLTVPGLADNTQYAFTVTALDPGGNESNPSQALNVTTDEIFGVTSSSTWQSFAESTQTGVFTATFDAVPNGAGVDAITGIQNGIAGSYGDLACIVRFNTSGQIDARNGGAYTATNTLNYTSGVTYHFRLEINVANHMYSVFVTPQGGSEVNIANGFAFRTEQASVSQLTGWSIYAASGSHNVDNVTFSTTGSDTQAPGVPSSLTAGTITESSVALSWTASTDNVGVAGYKVYTNGANPVTTGSTSATISGLSASTQYSFTVSAYDAASNESSQSSAVNATTQSGSSITSYYVDPATGSMGNPGTSSQPWSTLEAVFTAGKTFQPGDIIYLRSGYHGFPTITGNNNDYVTITAEAGQNPGVKKLIVSDASKWVISGLTVSPELVSSYEKGDFVSIASTSSYITLDNCYIYSTLSISGWSSSDVTGKFGDGIKVSGPNCTISNNLIKQTNYSIEVTKTAVGTEVSYNTIEGFLGDAIRGLSGYSKYEYNTIKTCYSLNSHHDDAFQSWSTNASGTVGAGVVYNVEFRGNSIINVVDPNQPFKNDGYGMQGIGNFDGFFENWVIENNLIVTDMWHGISFYGARNCRIVNNTVIENPINLFSYVPWIAVFDHKNGTASTDNIMYNNFTSDIESTVGTTTSNNIATRSYASHLVDFTGFDFRLQPTSSAVNGGTASMAPTIDLNKYPRSGNPDVGCYELGTSATGGDTIAPGVPTGLTVGAITASSVALSWNASTDDVGVAGYTVYINGSNPVTSSATNTVISNLAGSTAYMFTVSAFDGSGNQSAQSSSVNATTLEQTGVTSNATFQSFILSAQSDTFTVEYDAIPNSNNIDAVTGIQNGSATSYSDMACIIRFNDSGQIDARNGGAYAATNTVNYTSGVSYHFRIEIDIPSHVYSVYATPQGGSEQIVASGFAFRTEQANVSQLTGWSLYAYSGSHTVDNMMFTSAGTVPVTNVSVSPSAITLEEGQCTDLLETVSPTNATNKSVTWSSSNASVATVNTSGLVCAISAGSATITVTTNDGSYTANCAVTVNSSGALPSPWASGDVGNVAATGSATYSGGTFTVQGSGSNIWNNADEFHYVYQQISGDAIITARVASITNTHQWTKGGVMMRETLSSNSVNGNTFVAPIASNGAKFSYRTTTGGTSLEFDGPNVTAPYWLRMERSGNTFTGYVSADGSTWTTLGSTTINMSSTYYVGLSVSSLSDGALATGTFDNVSVTSTSTVPVTGISVSPTTLALDEGQDSDLTETVSPANATDKSVTWSSNNTMVATVDANGLVSAISAGSATITVTTNDGGYSATSAVAVSVPVIPVVGVVVSPTTLTLDEGQTSTLAKTVSPTNATHKTVTWSSNNTSVATVSSGGLVTAIAEGNATITVTTDDGGYTDNCAVTVNAVSTETNLALNRPVTVSAYQDDAYGYKPGENLVDGDVSDDARWSASGFPQWAEVDLGANYDLNQIDVYPYQNRAYQYIVESKPDGGSYTTIVDKSANTESADLLVNSVDITARYVKITVSGLYGSSSTWVSLADLQVWGTVPATIPVTGVTLSSTSLTLDEGQTSDLDETVNPTDATDKSVTWSSSNTSVATVDANGLVSAISAGSATITVTTNDGSYTATCSVTVNAAPAQDWIEDFSELSDGTTEDNGATAWSISASGTNTDVVLEVSNGNFLASSTGVEVLWISEIISISGSADISIDWGAAGNMESTDYAKVYYKLDGGSETLIAEHYDVFGRTTQGTTVNGSSVQIIIKLLNSAYDESYTLYSISVSGQISSTVSVTGVSLSSTTLTLDESQTSDLSETVSPANATDQSVTWSSSNTSVATVDANGLVTAVSAGSATITVTTNDGSYTATCSVTVNAAPAQDWIEDFSELSDGTTEDNGATAWSISASGTNTDVVLEVSSGNFLASSTGVEVLWISEIISISGSTDISIDWGASGNMESIDYAKVYYKLNGGSETLIAEHYDVFGRTTQGTTVNGSSVQIIVKLLNSAYDESYTLYSISVTASQSSAIAMKELGEDKDVLNVYPNPLNGDILNIKAHGYDEANIIIYDIMGKTVYNQSHSMVERSELQIPAGNLNKGIYIISVNGEQRKLIIE